MCLENGNQFVCLVCISGQIYIQDIRGRDILETEYLGHSCCFCRGIKTAFLQMEPTQTLVSFVCLLVVLPSLHHCIKSSQCQRTIYEGLSVKYFKLRALKMTGGYQEINYPVKYIFMAGRN